MRLLESNREDDSLNLVQCRPDQAPSYAILSHTWNHSEEYTFEDLTQGVGQEKPGYAKIQFCRNQAVADGLHYFWVDTCCIDKSNNTELTTAITSMFRYYQNAAKCYVYLSDVFVPAHIADPQSCTPIWEGQFRRSRWLTRGWTLQELLAPEKVEFFARDGRRLGDKNSLERILHEATTISVQALRGTPLSHFSVAERLRWASMRTTTEKEDEAYCLLGIFGVYMPLIYGEGRNAFVRLRKKIDKSFHNGPHGSYMRSIDLERSMTASTTTTWIGSSGTLNNTYETDQSLKHRRYPSTTGNTEEMEFSFPNPSSATTHDDFGIRSEVFDSTPSLTCDTETHAQIERDLDSFLSDDDDFCVISPDEDARRMRIREGKKKCLESEVPFDAATSDFAASSSDAIPRPPQRQATNGGGQERGKGKCLSEPRRREVVAEARSTQERHVWQHSELQVFSSPLDWVAQFQRT